jgi:SAM-dependent methyltransferase
MKASDQPIPAHHQPAAAMWGRGGKEYDEVSFAISDALAHAAQRLNARAGERILDVATGTGWSARNVARRGATVTGVDISPELLAAAGDLSQHIRPPIEFRLADAEQLPFDDGAFDGVISTFGVMLPSIKKPPPPSSHVCAAPAVAWFWPPGRRRVPWQNFSGSLPSTATHRLRPHRR